MMISRARHRLFPKRKPVGRLLGAGVFGNTLSTSEAKRGMMNGSRVALVTTDEEPSAYIIRVTRIGEIGTTSAVISNRRKLQAE
jgi:hypothetical protein